RPLTLAGFVPDYSDGVAAASHRLPWALMGIPNAFPGEAMRTPPQMQAGAWSRSSGTRGAASFVRSLQRVDVELFHLQHRRHGPLRFFPVLVLQHLVQDRGNELPRQTVADLETPALDFLAPRSELLPQ